MLVEKQNGVKNWNVYLTLLMLHCSKSNNVDKWVHYIHRFCLASYRHTIGISTFSCHFVWVFVGLSLPLSRSINGRVSEIATGIIPREELKSTFGQWENYIDESHPLWSMLGMDLTASYQYCCRHQFSPTVYPQYRTVWLCMHLP